MDLYLHHGDQAYSEREAEAELEPAPKERDGLGRRPDAGRTGCFLVFIFVFFAFGKLGGGNQGDPAMAVMLDGDGIWVDLQKPAAIA